MKKPFEEILEGFFFPGQLFRISAQDYHFPKRPTPAQLLLHSILYPRIPHGAPLVPLRWFYGKPPPTGSLGAVVVMVAVAIIVLPAAVTVVERI